MEDLNSDWPKEHVMTIQLVLDILRDLDKKQLKKLKELSNE